MGKKRRKRPDSVSFPRKKTFKRPEPIEIITNSKSVLKSLLSSTDSLLFPKIIPKSTIIISNKTVPSKNSRNVQSALTPIIKNKIDTIYHKCDSLINQILSIQSVCSILKQSVESNSPKVYQLCIAFIRDNFELIKKTNSFNQLDEKLKQQIAQYCGLNHSQVNYFNKLENKVDQIKNNVDDNENQVGDDDEEEEEVCNLLQPTVENVLNVDQNDVQQQTDENNSIFKEQEQEQQEHNQEAQQQTPSSPQVDLKTHPKQNNGVQNNETTR